MSYETKIIYNGNDDIEYVFKASPGTLESSSEWQISKLSYDVNGNLDNVSFANGSASFQFKATEYLNYKYTSPMVSIVNPIVNISAGFIVDFNETSSLFNLLGNAPIIPTSEGVFNTADYVQVFYEGGQKSKGSEVQWVNTHTIKINFSVEKDMSIIVKS